MKVFNTARSIQKQLISLNFNKSFGFVPTMGALHSGHLSLIERAKKENNFVIASIFVNPTQFDKKEDLDKYPNPIESDLELLSAVECDFVFIPSVDEMYDTKIKSETFDFNGLDKVMEGAFREGHFDGVGTIVKKFFEIIQPQKAYFGEKDFQQLQIIKLMVKKNNLPIQIIPCDIYREKDGLAMSSRNSRLSAISRQAAPFIYQTLVNCKNLIEKRNINDVKITVKTQFKNNSDLELEYFEIADITTLTPTKHIDKNKKYRAFIAVRAGSIRLIDNIALN